MYQMLPFNSIREGYEKPLVSQIESAYNPENKILSRMHMQILGNNFLDKFMIPKGYKESIADDFVNVLTLLADHNHPVFRFWPICATKLANTVFVLKGKVITYKVGFDPRTRMEVGDNIEHVCTEDNIELKWDLLEMYPTVPIDVNGILQIRPVVYMSYQLYDFP